MYTLFFNCNNCNCNDLCALLILYLIDILFFR